MSHTPGPWTYYPPIMDDKTGVIINVGAREESIIATLHHPLGEGETLDANARLITESLNMLKALEQIATIVTGSKAQMENQIAFARRTANEAIRKARGG